MKNTDDDCLIEICEGIYRIKVPLPNFHQLLNAYLIRGDDSYTLIDMGENHPACEKAILEALSRFGLSWKDTKVLITHLHPDHASCLNRVYSPDMQIYGHFLSPLQELLECRSVIPTILQFNAMIEDNRGDGRKTLVTEELFDLPTMHAPVVRLNEGDSYQAGEYNFDVLETPGHDNTHLCLFDKNTKVMIIGDMLLDDRFPTTVTYDMQNNVLEKYFDSLKKIGTLSADVVLPGHGGNITNLEERIQETLDFHEAQLCIVRDAVSRGLTSYRDISYEYYKDNLESWKKSSLRSKYFTVGQLLSYLIYLVHLGDLQMTMSNTDFSVDIKRS